MCDACLADYCSSRDATTDATAEDVIETINCCTHKSLCEAEIEELKTKVSDIVDVLTTMISQRTEQETYRQQHSTPVSPAVYNSQLLNGTRDTSEFGPECVILHL